ncbi:MAG: aldolase/citrate lyase family protein [Alphaproteobacteria bacterium]|nr:aldolase/citrate lyase family protein [Alphaproteobacteria bacterium]
MRKNPLKEIWASGGVVRNTFLALDSTMSAEGAASLGWDAVTVDLQHGFADERTARQMFQAISAQKATPLARVAWNDPAKIMRLLDDGCYGLICPMVNTAEEAAAFVKSSKYPPLGARSYGPQRGFLYGGPDYAAKANETVINLAMIETAEALSNLPAIAATPGIDGVYIGPSDLAISLGEPPAGVPTIPRVVEAIEAILRGAKQAGVVTGLHCGTAEMAAEWAAKGFDMVTVGSDYTAMMAHMAQSLRTLDG